MPNLSEVYANFQAKVRAEEAQRAKIEKAEARLEKARAKLRAMSCYFVRDLVEPLAASLAEHLGYSKPEISGPSGLGARVSVYLPPEGVSDAFASDPRTIRFTVEPGDLRATSGGTALRIVNCSQAVNDYAPGSLGWMNGFNYGSLPLRPDLTAEEFLALVRSCDYAAEEQTEG